MNFTTQLCVDYFINHEIIIRIPIEQVSISWISYPRLVFFWGGSGVGLVFFDNLPVRLKKNRCLELFFLCGEAVKMYLEDHPRTCKWLESPPFISHERTIWKGNNPILRGLTITMVIHHVLTGMILPGGIY